jgi:hypothetical protein
MGPNLFRYFATRTSYKKVAHLLVLRGANSDFAVTNTPASRRELHKLADVYSHMVTNIR